ncbi:DoxX family protein [Streptomyces chartreusis]|uniref:DoxX family protein n=1 Tax=Streptomyces chartreusis TaxID=1969 RepID=UPI0035D585B4
MNSGRGRTQSMASDTRSASRPHETLTRLGVPSSWYTMLALLKFAGAAGLLIGIFYRPLGIAAAIGVVLFFIGAVISHLRVRDVKAVPVPFVLVLASAAPLVLGLATL